MRLRPGFALLLSAALAAGCSDDGLAGQSTAAAAETSTTGGDGGSTGVGTSADPATATGSGVEEGTTTSVPEVDSSSTTTEADSSTTRATDSTGTTSDTDTTTDGPSDACVEGCAIEFMCSTEWSSEDECVMWCDANLEEADAFSPFCRAAWEAVSACVGTLTCEEFAQWQDPTMFPYPCSDADAILNVECEGQ